MAGGRQSESRRSSLRQNTLSRQSRTLSPSRLSTPLTTAIISGHHAGGASIRISKHRQGSPTQQRPHGNALRSSKLSDDLDQYQVKLQEAINLELTENATKLLDELSQTTLTLTHDLENLKLAETTLHFPFAAELVQIATVDNTENQNGRPCLTQTLLKDRMIAFERLITKQQELLGNLWEEWAATQAELVQLVVETCGSKAIQTNCGQESKSIRKCIENGQQRHAEVISENKKFASSLDDINKDVRDLTTTTTDTLLAHQEDFETSREKFLEKINSTIDHLRDLYDDDKDRV